jgi:hypothetical protein
MATASASLSPPPFPQERHWLFGSGYLLRHDAAGQMKFFLEKYGDIVSLSVPMNKVVIAGSPTYAKYVLLDNNRNYTKSLAYDLLKLLLGNGILTSEGEVWKQQRRLVQPAFHKQRLAEMVAMMVQRTQLELQLFEAYATSGDTVDVVTTMTGLTLDIISQAIFSEGVGGNSAAIAGYITMLNHHATEKLNQPIRLPAGFPTPFNIKERKAIASLNQIIFDIIDARRADGTTKGDLLSMLLDARDEETGKGMTNLELRDELMTIFIAGNETTANAMAWTLYLLSQNPEKEHKMIAEIDRMAAAGIEITFDSLGQWSYVRQVIEESMRYYPAAWAVGRRAISDDVIGGYHIASGTNVLIPIIYFHHSAKYWEQPEAFLPERFDADKRNAIDRFVYLPFGAGPRVCIGNHFALMEMQIILIGLYRKFRLTLAPEAHVVPDSMITLRPKYGMKMKVERRG